MVLLAQMYTIKCFIRNKRLAGCKGVSGIRVVLLPVPTQASLLDPSVIVDYFGVRTSLSESWVRGTPSLDVTHRFAFNCEGMPLLCSWSIGNCLITLNFTMRFLISGAHFSSVWWQVCVGQVCLSDCVIRRTDDKCELHKSSLQKWTSQCTTEQINHLASTPSWGCVLRDPIYSRCHGSNLTASHAS